MSNGAIAAMVILVLLAILVAVAAGYTAFLFGATLLRRLFDGTWAPGLWRAGYAEIWAGARIAAWSIDDRRNRLPPRKDPQTAAGASVVVVLVHGAAVDGSCMKRWAAAIVDSGIEAPILAPDHGVITSPLVVHGARLNAFLRRVLEVEPNVSFVLVGHSMGGLVMRRALADDELVRTATIGAITVATPHLGTAFARHGWLERFVQLSPGHLTVTGLPPLSTLVPRAVTFGSPLDVIVYPYENTIQEGIRSELIAGHGHAALLTDPVVAQQVADAVRSLIVDAGRLP